MQKLAPTIKGLVQSTKVICNITIPSQKHALCIIAHHEELSGISAAWNYFKAGHGKGPCKGIGGTTKRMADDAVKQRKLIILDAYDFYSKA